MTERITDLEGRVQRSRLALEALAERAAHLRGRLAALRRGEGETRGHLAASVPISDAEAAEADDFISDAWEIALINEEAK